MIISLALTYLILFSWLTLPDFCTNSANHINTFLHAFYLKFYIICVWYPYILSSLWRGNTILPHLYSFPWHSRCDSLSEPIKKDWPWHWTYFVFIQTIFCIYHVNLDPFPGGVCEFEGSPLFHLFLGFFFLNSTYLSSRVTSILQK